MNLTVLSTFLSRFYFHAPVAAQATFRVFDEMGVGAAILLTMVGVALHWRLPGLRMSAEEHVKDGKMTEGEARRRVRFYSRCAPIVTLIGVSVLIAVMFDLSQ